MMKQLAYGFFMIGLLVGCSQEQPETYVAPKEDAAVPAAQPKAMGSQAENEAIIAAHKAMNAQAQESEFDAKLPEGWTEKAGSGMRMVSYTIEGTSIDFYLISLSMGDVPSNVNRWRGQVGLPSASPQEIADEVETFTIGAHETNYIEIYNEEAGQGIIAAIIDLSPKYWYFTAKGSVDELKAHAADIREFLGSITFKGHDH